MIKSIKLKNIVLEGEIVEDEFGWFWACRINGSYFENDLAFRILKLNKDAFVDASKGCGGIWPYQCSEQAVLKTISKLEAIASRRKHNFGLVKYKDLYFTYNRSNHSIILYTGREITAGTISKLYAWANDKLSVDELLKIPAKYSAEFSITKAPKNCIKIGCTNFSKFRIRKLYETLIQKN